MKRMTFKEYYAKYFYEAPEGSHWAGAAPEFAHDVHKRLADAMAAYLDYVVDLMERE